MTSPAYEIAHWLEDQDSGDVGEVGASTGWALSVGTEPDAPNDAITVYDTGGEPPDNDDQSVFYHTVQVRVRGFDYQAVHAKQEQIRDLLIAGPFGSFVAVWQQSQP